MSSTDDRPCRGACRVPCRGTSDLLLNIVFVAIVDFFDHFSVQIRPKSP
jgi:hypothetical protein